MKLQYQIIEIFHPYYVNGRFKRDHAGWKIWIGDKRLLKETNEKFSTMFVYNEFNPICDETARNIWDWYRSRNDLIGMYGDEDDNKQSNKVSVQIVK